MTVVFSVGWWWFRGKACWNHQSVAANPAPPIIYSCIIVYKYKHIHIQIQTHTTANTNTYNCKYKYKYKSSERSCQSWSTHHLLLHQSVQIQTNTNTNRAANTNTKKAANTNTNTNQKSITILLHLYHFLLHASRYFLSLDLQSNTSFRVHKWYVKNIWHFQYIKKFVCKFENVRKSHVPFQFSYFHPKETEQGI